MKKPRAPWVISLPSLHVKRCLTSHYMEDVNKRRGNFPTLSELGYGIIETLVLRPS